MSSSPDRPMDLDEIIRELKLRKGQGVPTPSYTPSPAAEAVMREIRAPIKVPLR